MKNCVSLSMLLLAAIGSGRGQAASSDRKLEVAKLAELLKEHQIERLEILHVSDTLRTVIAVTPETVREVSTYRVTVKKPEETASQPGLLTALKELELSKPGHATEVRWAILFFDTTGKERFAVFLSRNGTDGFFEDMPITLQGKLLAWSKGLIRAAFLQGAPLPSS